MSQISNHGAPAFNLFKQTTSLSTGTGDVDPSCITYTGLKFDLEDGREVTIVSNGAVALVSGVLVQSSPVVALHQNLTVAVPATVPATAGTFKVQMTVGATKVNANQYTGGFLVVNAGTGIGQTLQIASNPGVAASGAGFIVTLADPIQVTLDATSKVSLHANLYQDVVINATTPTGVAVGVTFYPVAAAVALTSDANGAVSVPGTRQYAFVVSKGLTSCLSDATVAAAGLGIAPSSSTAGTVTVMAATLRAIGTTLTLGVSAESRAVYIDL